MTDSQQLGAFYRAGCPAARGPPAGRNKWSHDGFATARGLVSSPAAKLAVSNARFPIGPTSGWPRIRVTPGSGGLSRARFPIGPPSGWLSTGLPATRARSQCRPNRPRHCHPTPPGPIGTRLPATRARGNGEAPRARGRGPLRIRHAMERPADGPGRVVRASLEPE